MRLPFTHEAFLDLFGEYNRAVWPVVLLLWLATIAALVPLYRGRPGAGRLFAGLLAFHWGWAGVVYHLLYFRRINPAALLFGLAFVAQAILLLWRGVIRPSATFVPAGSRWGRSGLALIVYALVYPALGLLFGLHFPRLPLFAVPCPTTILTAGALLLAPRAEARILGGIPVLWAAVGGSAAFVLGMRADLVLPLAGALLLVHMFGPARSSRSGPA